MLYRDQYPVNDSPQHGLCKVVNGDMESILRWKLIVNFIYNSVLLKPGEFGTQPLIRIPVTLDDRLFLGENSRLWTGQIWGMRGRFSEGSFMG